MIELFGPTYRYQGEVLDRPEIIYVNDHQYDENNHCFHLTSLLENSTCDPQQHFVIFDHLNHEDELQHYPHVSVPVWLASSVSEFVQQRIQPDWSQKTHVFNFMINKPRPHREFLLMLIKHFGLDNYCHSLAWRRININLDSIKKSVNNNLYRKIIDSVQVDTPVTDYRFGPEIALEQGVLNGSFKNSETYQHLLQKTLFEPTCVSLITEPMCFERESMHTEKTLMAIYGGTFPIWVGGWRLADHLAALGFDVFDDIIDHSYQDMMDPWDRCYYAIERNLKLLQDFTRARELIAANQHRLAHNVQLCQDNVFMQYCLEKTQQQTPAVQRVLDALMTDYAGRSSYRSLNDYQLLGNAPQGTTY